MDETIKKKRWKCIGEIVKIGTPFLLALATYCGITTQLDYQNKAQKEQFQSQLLLKALEQKDDSLLVKLISAGFLDDSKKRYSFLIKDTVFVKKPRSITFADTSTEFFKDITKWDKGHIKLFGNDCAEGSNFHAKVSNTGYIVFTCDIEAMKFLEELTLTVNFMDKNGSYISNLPFPTITVPNTNPTRKTTIVFEAYEEQIKNNFSRIDRVNTEWR